MRTEIRHAVVQKVRTLSEVLSRSVAQRRFQMLLVLRFALAGLALAAFGTYGVLSYAVTRRTPEMGIRMALGAQRRDVLAMVLRQGIMPVLAGLAAGVLSALVIGRYLESCSSRSARAIRWRLECRAPSFCLSPWRPAWSRRAAPPASAPSKPCASNERSPCGLPIEISRFLKKCARKRALTG